MSTRAVVAVPDGDAWRGRYTHWDGFPVHHAPELLTIVQRDGLRTAVDVLTVQNWGWSSIDHKETRTGPGDLGERSRLVPGYGDAYTDAQSPSGWDEWITPDDQDSWCLYAYVLAPDGLGVLARGEDGWDAIHRFSWSDDPGATRARLLEPLLARTPDLWVPEDCDPERTMLAGSREERERRVSRGGRS